MELRLYRIIYDAIDDVKAAMKGMLAPKTREVELGRIEVRQVYKITNVGTVAGCYVLRRQNRPQRPDPSGPGRYHHRCGRHCLSEALQGRR